MSAICDTHKKKVNVEQLYNSMRRKFYQLGIRPVGEKMLEWGTCPRDAVPPGPWLSSPGERERNAVEAIRVGVNMLKFCSVSISLSHITFSIKWEVYFSKELCRSSWFCIQMYMYYVAIQHKQFYFNQFKLAYVIFLTQFNSHFVLLDR